MTKEERVNQIYRLLVYLSKFVKDPIKIEGDELCKEYNISIKVLVYILRKYMIPDKPNIITSSYLWNILYPFPTREDAKKLIEEFNLDNYQIPFPEEKKEDLFKPGELEKINQDHSKIIVHRKSQPVKKKKREKENEHFMRALKMIHEATKGKYFGSRSILGKSLGVGTRFMRAVTEFQCIEKRLDEKSGKYYWTWIDEHEPTYEMLRYIRILMIDEKVETPPKDAPQSTIPSKLVEDTREDGKVQPVVPLAQILTNKVNKEIADRPKFIHRVKKAFKTLWYG